MRHRLHDVHTNDEVRFDNIRVSTASSTGGRTHLSAVLEQVITGVRPQELVDAVLPCFPDHFSLIEQPSP